MYQFKLKRSWDDDGVTLNNGQRVKCFCERFLFKKWHPSNTWTYPTSFTELLFINNFLSSWHDTSSTLHFKNRQCISAVLFILDVDVSFLKILKVIEYICLNVFVNSHGFTNQKCTDLKYDSDRSRRQREYNTR